ncbi:MAG: L-fucose isomerase-like protein [Rhodothermales bacterium]|jgi:L-fucose isomerase-like protein
MSISLGFVPGHRPSFSQDWALEMRRTCVDALTPLDLELVVPEGVISNIEEAESAWPWFAERGVEALLLGTMTFGDEEALAEIAQRLYEIKPIPIALFGTLEPVDGKGIRAGSDSFCGTLSVAMNLQTAGIPFRFLGILDPKSAEFATAVAEFVTMDAARVRRNWEEAFARPYPGGGSADSAITAAAVEAFRHARFGQFGPRASGFVTCAFDERQMLRQFGQRVVPIDLAEVFGRATGLDGDDAALAAARAKICERADLEVDAKAFEKMARLYVSLQQLITENRLVAAGHNCWLSIQTQYGISGCAVFSLLEDEGIPITCETDVYGAASMLLAKVVAAAHGDETPPIFMDWTIRHPEDRNLFQAWHCGKAPWSVFRDRPVIRTHEIIGRNLSDDICQGTVEGEFCPGEVTLSRLVEYNGRFRCLVTRGVIEIGEWPEMRGSWGWVRIDDLERLYRVLCEKGFSHHVVLQYGDYRASLASTAEELGIEVVWI